MNFDILPKILYEFVCLIVIHYVFLKPCRMELYENTIRLPASQRLIWNYV